MTVTKAVEAFLEDYYFTLSEKEKLDFESKGYTTWQLGTDEQTSSRQVNLVVKNQKRAISTLFNKKDIIPAVDSYGILLDYREKPACLVRYVKFDVKPFNKITIDFAQEEGAQDMDEWHDEHREMFRQLDPDFIDESLILCGSFRLVFKASPD